ncbi:hypothetical protein GCM10027515_05650 [Schumannella luteola]|uniref:Putative membrane protein n=1 Tax=Schumannella luteola TaxID=472059 RepID=A0A852Y8W4_9MICO|nr:DUF1772 domain-containing protein [Schumannella luteola]NYG98302.1 putative membrane protein [Schumannella luteola]TPX05735.1 DUF1772 domain-containing protein [Schumannella luteola]
MDATTLLLVLTIVGVVLAGLGAGILLGFAAGVLPGMRRVDDGAFVGAFRAINKGVMNPLFLGPLFLPLFALGAAAIVGLSRGTATPIAAAASASDATTTPGEAVVLLFAAAALQLAGVIGVTLGANVPRNDALERDGGREPRAARAAFERPWTAWNAVRTLAAVASTVLAVIALALL